MTSSNYSSLFPTLSSQLTRALAMWLPSKWPHRSWVTYLLLPLSVIYAAVIGLRRFAYGRGILAVHKFDIPVVVIGNITTGGTGKTPMVLATAKALAHRGFKPGILCRGYLGEATEWPLLVEPYTDVRAVGDEAVLMARRGLCPVVAGPDRVASADRLIKEGCDIIISDDGLQHYRLHRDFEIALVQSNVGLGNGFLLPAGPLRERPSRLARCDAVVMTRADQSKTHHAVVKVPAQVPVLGANYTNPWICPVIADANSDEAQPLHNWVGSSSHLRRQGQQHSSTMRVHGVAGIGHPERFFSMLREAGLTVISHPFPDHYHYSEQDLDFHEHLPIVMTEKDAVKCQNLKLTDAFYVTADFDIDPNYFQLLFERIGDVHKTRCQSPHT